MDPTENPTTMVLLSGGMKSSVLLLELVRLKRRPVAEALIIEFDDEMSYFPPAKAMCERAGVPFSYWMANLSAFLDASTITGLAPDDFPTEKLRLIQMLAISGARAKERGYQEIAAGITRADLEMTEGFFHEIKIGICKAFELPDDVFSFPYMQWETEDFFWEAKELGILGEILAYTNSCTAGDHETKNEGWGYGCGECDGCLRRADGFRKYLSRLKAQGE